MLLQFANKNLVEDYLSRAKSNKSLQIDHSRNLLRNASIVGVEVLFLQ